MHRQLVNGTDLPRAPAARERHTKRSWAAGALALGLATAIPAAAGAATITFDATASGAYLASGQRVNAPATFLTGQLNREERRSYLAFDLTGLAGTVTGARLRLFNPEVSPFQHGYASPQATETLAFWDVTTLATSFLDGSAGVAGFADLGTGTQFGTRSVSAVDNGTVIEIDLNAAAVAALNAAAGGDFLLGGSLTTLFGIFDQYVFAYTMTDFVPDHTRQLVLDVIPAAAVPEPSALLLAGTALFLIGLARARRKGGS